MKRTLTKVMASLLAVLMLIGALPFASVAAADNELPEKPDNCFRYYFYQPEDWPNEYSDTVDIYWWEGADCCESWPGYAANETDVEGVYYYDVPRNVISIIWNNAVNGGLDDTQDIYTAVYQTDVIGTEYYDIGENFNYPDGTDNFDEMIYVIDPDLTEVNEISGRSVFKGEWYYYYGNGEYGFAENKEDAEEIFTGSYRSIYKNGKVVSIETPEEPVELYANVDGYKDERFNDETDMWEDYFHYDIGYSQDCYVKVTYENGFSEDVNIVDTVNGEGFRITSNQYEEPWESGGEYSFTISIFGIKAEIPVKIIKYPVDSIEVVEGEIICVENYGGYWREKYNIDTDEWEDFYEYDYDLYDFVFRINYKDGTSEELGWYDETEEGYEVYSSDNQYETPWTIGGENFIVFSFMGVETKFPVEVIENPVESIEVVEGEIVCIENYNGYWDERYNSETGEWEDYYEYDYDLYDFVFRINYKDGTSEELDWYDETEEGFYLYYEDNQEEVPWTLGKENTIVFGILGVETEFSVEVVENPVESIEVVDGEIACIENHDGYWNNRYNSETDEWEEYFHYSYNLVTFIFRINYKDGTSEELEYYDVTEEGYEVCSYDFQYDEPWKAGGEYVVVFEFLGVETEVYAKVEENPVERIELYEGTADKYMYNTDGYFNYIFNDETEEYERFFCYYLFDHRDAKIKIYYTDGTNEIAHVGEEVGEGLYVELDSNQNKKPWKLGENEVIISYLGAETTLPVIVEKTDVESVRLLNDVQITVMEETNGWWEEDYNVATSEWEYYYYYDINELIASVDEIELHVEYIGGYEEVVSIYSWDVVIDFDEQYYYHWSVGSDNTIDVCYRGITIEIPVTIIPNPNKPIEPIVPDPSEPTDPVEPDPSEPTDPVDPDPSKPTDPAEPDASKPTDPAEPDQSKPTDPTEATEPSAQATAPTETVTTEPTEEATTAPSTEDESEPVTEDKTEPSTGGNTTAPTDPIDKGTVGDVSGDGKVNIKDATQIQKYAAKLVDLTDAEFVCADVNADGKVNVKDATAIQKHVAKFDTGLPIEKPVA